MGAPVRLTAALGLAACLAAPVGAQDNPVQDLIDAALRRGDREVTIPPGLYPIRNGRHFEFRKVADFTVRAEGVKAVFAVRKTAMIIEDCRNLEIGGLTLDYDPLPFTQGTIAAAAPDWSHADVEIHAGYPQALPSGARIEVKSPDGLLKPDVMMIYGTRVETLRPGAFRIHGTGAWRGKVSLGDYVVDHYPDQGGYHGIDILRSVDVTLRDFTFHSSPGYAVHTYGCDGGAFLNFRFSPGPPPPGASVPRLRTGHADGIHCENPRRGPRFEDCLIEANGDDGIAIHGDFARLTRDVSGGRVLTVDTVRHLHIRPGDTLVHLGADKGPGFRAVALSASGSEVTLDREVSGAAGTFLYNADAIGSGYVIRNCVTRNHRARGFLVRGDRGLIEGNTVDWVQEAAIALFPEWGMWAQSGLARDVRIVRNTVRRAALVGWAKAVDISVPEDPAAGALSGIEFSGNTVDSCVGLPLFVSSAARVSIRDNVFRNAQASREGVIRLQHGEGIEVAGNCVQGLAAGRNPLSVSGVTNLRGQTAPGDWGNPCVTGLAESGGRRKAAVSPKGPPGFRKARRDALGRKEPAPAASPRSTP